MLQKGEIVLIDVEDSGLGHPVLDLSSMYLVYVTAAKSNWKSTNMGITKEQFARIWDIIIRKYFNTNDQKEIAEINRILEGYSMIKLIRGLATSPSVPNLLRKPLSAGQIKKMFKVIDTLHPIPEL
jgi:thiamine kinase-like enzyme